MSINSQDVINAMNWRAAVKVFNKDKTIDKELLDTIIEAGRLAPTAYGLQPVKIIDVSENLNLRAKIREIGFNQAQITEAPNLFVITTTKEVNENLINDLIKRTATARNIPVENLKGYEDMMKGDILSKDTSSKSAWSDRQAYLAFGSMLTTAALLGVDAAPMEGFIPQKVDEILDLDNLNLRSLGLLALGYRDESDTYNKMAKVRLSKEEFVIKK